MKGGALTLKKCRPLALNLPLMSNNGTRKARIMVLLLATFNKSIPIVRSKIWISKVHIYKNFNFSKVAFYQFSNP